MHADREIIPKAVFAQWFYLHIFFPLQKRCSHKTFQWNEFVGCNFTFLLSTERCGIMEQSKNINNIYCCFCVWNSPWKRPKERIKKKCAEIKMKSREAKQLLFQFDVRFSSVTGDHHITCGHKASQSLCVCVWMCIFIFALSFFCEHSRRSVWHFHFVQAILFI